MTSPNPWELFKGCLHALQNHRACRNTLNLNFSEFLHEILFSDINSLKVDTSNCPSRSSTFCFSRYRCMHSEGVFICAFTK